VSEPVESQSKRDLLTKLLPSIAFSAVKAGITGSPISILTNAATKYNEEAEKTKGMVKDLLPLIPGYEKLQVSIVGSNAVSLVMQRQDLLGCAEVYLSRVFKQEGSDGAPAGPPAGEGEREMFQYALRLPFKSVYLKLVENLSDEEISRLLDYAKKVNPAEVWVVADTGKGIDQKLDPVFISENRTLRGRVRSVPTAAMLREFFGERFAVAFEPAGEGSLKVTLRLIA
jgi:hypothetical protein